MNYSFVTGILKGIKYAILFLVAGLIVGLKPEIKELTVGGALVLLLNFLKIKFGVKIPLLDYSPKEQP